jgi:hypothetical protein
VHVRHAASHPLQWDRSDKVALADLHPAMPQNGVGGGEMEIVVRQHKVIEIVGAFHQATGAAAKREFDVAVDGGINRFGIERLQICNRFGEPRFELIDRRLGVLDTRRFGAGEPRGAASPGVARVRAEARYAPPRFFLIAYYPCAVTQLGL